MKAKPSKEGYPGRRQEAERAGCPRIRSAHERRLCAHLCKSGPRSVARTRTQTAVVVAGELTSAVGTYVHAPPAVAGALVDFQGTPQAGLKILEATTMGEGSILELIALPRGLGTPAPGARDTASTSLEQLGAPMAERGR